MFAGNCIVVGPSPWRDLRSRGERRIRQHAGCALHHPRHPDAGIPWSEGGTPTSLTTTPRSACTPQICRPRPSRSSPPRSLASSPRQITSAVRPAVPGGGHPVHHSGSGPDGGIVTIPQRRWRPCTCSRSRRSCSGCEGGKDEQAVRPARASRRSERIARGGLGICRERRHADVWAVQGTNESLFTVSRERDARSRVLSSSATAQDARSSSWREPVTTSVAEH